MRVEAVDQEQGPARALTGGLSELARFGVVGGAAYVVDVSVYNAVRLTVLDDRPIIAKVVSVAVATVAAWLGNRHFVFARSGTVAAVREFARFAAVNVVGLVIAAVCLLVSHYLLGFTSALADNISANVVGLILGAAFRYLAYRHVVFAPSARDDATGRDMTRSTASRPGRHRRVDQRPQRMAGVGTVVLRVGSWRASGGTD